MTNESLWDTTLHSEGDLVSTIVVFSAIILMILIVLPFKLYIAGPLVISVGMC